MAVTYCRLGRKLVHEYAVAVEEKLDGVSFWSTRDELDRLALGVRPTESWKSGIRRWVTIIATLIALFVWLVSLEWGATSDPTVILFDLILIVMLVIYRAAKTWGDKRIEVRGAAEASEESWNHSPKSFTRAT